MFLYWRKSAKIVQCQYNQTLLKFLVYVMANYYLKVNTLAFVSIDSLDFCPILIYRLLSTSQAVQNFL